MRWLLIIFFFFFALKKTRCYPTFNTVLEQIANCCSVISQRLMVQRCKTAAVISQILNESVFILLCNHCLNFFVQYVITRKKFCINSFQITMLSEISSKVDHDIWVTVVYHWNCCRNDTSTLFRSYCKVEYLSKR